VRKQFRQQVIVVCLVLLGVVAVGCDDDEWRSAIPPPSAAPTPTLSPHYSLATRGRWIVDQQGRIVILRGVNYNGIESMLFTEQPPELDDFKKIRRWGFNVIRFPISWEFVEPERDQYDEEYLKDWVEPVLDFAAEEGIGVILTMHQWNWSSCFVPPSGSVVTPAGRGNGLPWWALPPAIEANCPYTGSDAATRMRSAEKGFWLDPVLLETYIEMWETMARRYGEHPAILAYDLFNEPPPDSMTSVYFDQQILQPFYQELIQRIRAVSPAPLIVYEPNISWDLFGNQFTPMPFAGIVYSPHIYTGGTAGGTTGYGGNPAPLLAEVEKAVSDAQAQGVPLYVGEFGIGMNDNYQQWIRDEFRFQEQYMVSATWWSMRQHNNATFGLTEFDTRAEKSGLLDVVSRPYPAATAGELLSFSYDDGTKAFTMTFSNSEDSSGDTIISIPDYQYHGRIKVQSSDPEGHWSYTFDPADGLLHVTVDPRQQVHTISVTSG
jgi:endoglycosylceramidase